MKKKEFQVYPIRDFLPHYYTVTIHETEKALRAHRDKITKEGGPRVMAFFYSPRLEKEVLLVKGAQPIIRRGSAIHKLGEFHFSWTDMTISCVTHEATHAAYYFARDFGFQFAGLEQSPEGEDEYLCRVQENLVAEILRHINKPIRL